MARYRVGHDLDRTWICKADDGSFYWGNPKSLKDSVLFPNYQAAKAALESLPDETRMYGVSYRRKVMFMKFYDSEEHREREEEARKTRRFLRNAGYL